MTTPLPDPRRGLLAPTRTTARRCAASCATGATTSSRSSTRRGRGRDRGRRAGRRDRRRRASASARTRRSSASRPRAAASRRRGSTSCAAASPTGCDVENGLHVFLADDRSCASSRARHDVELRDLRRPPADLSTATGANLEVPGTIVLTVGSDCAIGKMTVALELDLEARRRGLASIFVPTGQTGIAIAGWGIAVDAVVADFIAGAAERLVVEGRRARRRAASGSRARGRSSIRSTPA